MCTAFQCCHRTDTYDHYSIKSNARLIAWMPAYEHLLCVWYKVPWCMSRRMIHALYVVDKLVVTWICLLPPPPLILQWEEEEHEEDCTASQLYTYVPTEVRRLHTYVPTKVRTLYTYVPTKVRTYLTKNQDWWSGKKFSLDAMYTLLHSCVNSTLNQCIGTVSLTSSIRSLHWNSEGRHRNQLDAERCMF